MKDFDSYSAEQWDCIAASIAKMRGVDDAHLIRRGGASLRNLIEIEASMYCAQGYLNRRAANRQACVDNLIALRDDLRDRLVSKLANTTAVGTDDMLNATEAFIRKLTFKIDLMTKIEKVSMVAHDEPGSNAAKTSRHRFWSELVAIWTMIGGEKTGAKTARFLIAAAKPAFDFVRGDADACDKDRAIPDQKSVEQWLLRHKSRPID